MNRTRRYIAWACIFVLMALMIAPAAPHSCECSASPFETSAEPATMIRADAQWSSSLVSELGLSSLDAKGRGVTIGVVDTGVDYTTLAPEVLKDLVDLTGEGGVTLSQPLTPSSSGTLTSGSQTFSVKNIPSKSGRFRVGQLKTQDLPDSSPLKTAAGSNFRISILVSDRYISGQYDTVYIDTDGDGSFSTEKGLEVFRNGFSGAQVRLPNSRFLHVVVSDIVDNGAKVLLGFDGHGHGTSIASVLAGNAPGLIPVAPQCSLVSVKAVDSSGRTGWDLLAQGILTACRKGAKIVIMSVAPLIPAESGSSLDDAIRRAEKEYGALVVVAAGNKGPGLSTLPDYAELPNVLSVGAYIPASAESAMSMPGNRLWPWSSLGPTSGGATVSLVAPAMGPAQVPAWISDKGNTWLFEGTSCAAAYAGGAAAVVASQAFSTGTAFSPVLLKQSLEDGGRPLPGVSSVEQGAGKLDAKKALELFKERKHQRVRVVAEWSGSYLASGFYDRNRIPGFIPFGVDSFLPFSSSLRLGLPYWASANTVSLNIPAVEQRNLSVRIDAELPQGLTSGFITGDDPELPGIEMKALATIVVPREFGEAGSLTTQKIIDIGMLHREYFRVDPGTEYLTVQLEVPRSSDGKPRGREQLYVYNAKGDLAHMGPWVGAEGTGVRDEVYLKAPEPGVWEAVIVSDPASRIFGTGEASFRLTLTKGGIAPNSAFNALEVAVDKNVAATGQIGLFNPGAAFTCKPMVIEHGQSGSVSVETLHASSFVSLPRPIAGVTESTRYLYLGVSQVSDPNADIDVYLYHLDPAVNRWVEVKASAKSGKADEELTLVNPPAGQYMAYIEVKGLQDAQTFFQWTTVVANDKTGYEAKEESNGVEAFTWDQNKNRIVRVSCPNHFTPAKQNKVYLALWDEGTGALRNLIPLAVTAPATGIVAYAGIGNSAGGHAAVTISALDSVSLKPLDALVRLGDRWFQLRDGKAQAVITGSNINNLDLYAEYPGMYPKIKTIRQ